MSERTTRETHSGAPSKIPRVTALTGPGARAAGCALIALAAIAVAGCGGSSSKPSPSTSSSQATTAAPGAGATPEGPAGTSSASTATATATGASTTVSASAGGVTARMRAISTHPKVNVPWPIHFVVSSGGAPAPASLVYEYLFGGAVVAHRSHYTFKGHFSDVFKWPASAVGYPLTFRAVIVSGHVTLNLDLPVQVVA